MLVRVEFEHMGQHDQIDAIAGEGQFAEIAAHLDRPARADTLTQGNAVLREKVDLWQTELQGVVAEKIADEAIHPRLFPGHDIAPLRRQQPVIDFGI